MRRDYEQDGEIYQLLEYINANNRRAYIDTGLTLNQFKFEADVKVISNTGYVPIITGVASAGQNAVMLGYQCQVNYLYGRGGNTTGYYQFRGITYVGVRHVYSIEFSLTKTPVLYVDGTAYNKSYEGSTTNPRTADKVLIFGNFGRWPYNTNFQAANFNYYGGKIWGIDGTLLRELKPMLKVSTGQAGLYDIVNNVFYTNQGTGEFLYA